MKNLKGKHRNTFNDFLFQKLEWKKQKNKEIVKKKEIRIACKAPVNRRDDIFQ